MLSLVYFRCPMLCTLSLNGLAGALELLSFVPGQDFEVITVSFDPHEGPVLASAKKRASTSQSLQALRGRAGLALPDAGPQASTEALTRAVGFRYVWDEETKQWAHPRGRVC